VSENKQLLHYSFPMGNQIRPSDKGYNNILTSVATKLAETKLAPQKIKTKTTMYKNGKVINSPA
jgi:hypothetical protein